jgi:hypothetical protein
MYSGAFLGTFRGNLNLFDAKKCVKILPQFKFTFKEPFSMPDHYSKGEVIYDLHPMI